MAHATIADVYSEYVRNYVETQPNDGSVTPRTQDEIQSLVHELGLRYEDVDDETFWSRIREEWLYGIDDRPFSAECLYCGALVPLEDENVLPPETDDEVAWTALSAVHAPDCEWITTRAHRVAPAGVA